MLNLFVPFTPSTVRLTPYETGEVYFKTNLAKSVAYYQSKDYPNQTSPLVRLISILFNDEELTSAYIRKVNANINSACNSVGITTKVDRGFGSKVYGLPADTVYMVMNDSKILDSRHWKDMTPITPLQYKYNDCTLTHPSRALVDESMIVSVDVMNLMYMYMSYRAYKIKSDQSYSISHFLMAYVYTNMIGDFFRLALLNNYLYTTPLLWLDENPFTMLSLKPHIRRMMKVITSARDKQPRYYGDYINLLPLMGRSFGDMYKVNTVLTRANTWVWLAVFMPMVDELITSDRLYVHSKINTSAYSEILLMGRIWLGNYSYFNSVLGTRDRLNKILKFLKDTR